MTGGQQYVHDMHTVSGEGVAAIYAAQGVMLTAPPALVLTSQQYREVIDRLEAEGRADTVRVVRENTTTGPGMVITSDAPPPLRKEPPVRYVNRAARRAAARQRRR